MPDNSNQPPKGDCVCFTAGPRGALFSLGVIHAYLTTDRKAPVVAAGVSVGALSAAAMHRAYAELNAAPDAERETARWKWFRRYLSFLAERPLDVVWNSVPDVSDMLAKRPPIRETARPDGPTWRRREQGARLEYYLLVKTVQFVSRIDIKISQVAKLGLHYVRWREDYPDRPWSKAAQKVSLLLLLGNAAAIAWRLCWTILLHPGFYWPRPYRDHIRHVERQWFRRQREEQGKDRRWGWWQWLQFRAKVFTPRPLFGAEWVWLGWMLAAPSTILMAALAIWLSFGLFGTPLPDVLANRWELCGLILACLASVFATAARIAKITKRDGALGVPGRLLQQAELRTSLLTDFQLRLSLDALFRNEDGTPGMIGTGNGVETLLVASPLDPIEADNRALAQVYTRSGVPQPVANALAACLAAPPLLRPLHVKKRDFPNWIAAETTMDPRVARTGIRLVDGAQVCANPIPPLFDQLKRWYAMPEMKEKAESLFASGLADYRVHLVHGSPIAGLPDKEADDLPTTGSMLPLPNTVDSAMKGLRLSKRRDAQLEVFQSNYQSEFALAVGQLTPKTAEWRHKRMLPVLIDEIGPETELRVKNMLRPSESELLRHAAAGCRATLAVLHREVIGEQEMECEDLMKALDVRRFDKRVCPDPGLHEICSHCTRKIRTSKRDRVLAGGTPYTQFVRERYLSPEFRARPGESMPPAIWQPPEPDGQRKPRVVFVASGGVFRGAFHIGMVGAMYQIRMKPDLVVGASVGTLMGAALGELFATKDIGTLHTLVDTFLRVNETVALTRQFKGAMRDLSTRARMVEVSFQDLRRKILEGAGEDPTFATAGAPAELIDGFSRLFLIPHRDTQQMAADFIAEDVAGAVAKFVKLLTEHTVERLGVRDSLLGTSLLEMAFAKILKQTEKNKELAQPFLNAGIGFLAVTVNLNTEMMEILGAQVPKQQASYDFMQAALSSSAFPLAFPARRESQIYPKDGRRDVFYGDGGMFDNLPLLPATMAVATGQLCASGSESANWAALKDRVKTPDLYVVGALDVDPSGNVNEDHGRSILAIQKRASSLEKNMKTDRYSRFVSRVDSILYQLAPELEAKKDVIQDPQLNAIVNGYVHAGVMVTKPTAKEFLNGTFAFCPSLNLKPQTIRKSISDGCFQLLKNVAELQANNCNSPEVRAMKGLLATGMVAPVRRREPTPVEEGICPFYTMDEGQKALSCPFAIAREKPDFSIWKECRASHGMAG